MRWKLEHILKKGGGGIILEDDALIAINKPAGLLVLPDRFNDQYLNLYNLLKDTFGNIFIVHRIDKDTSGVILFAKTSESHHLLNDAFEQRRVEKIYWTIVAGTPDASMGSIDLPIIETSTGDKKMKIDRKNGKKAQTDYKVIEQLGKYTYMEIRPHTGRTHQIRVHLSAIGLPIIADPLYSDGQGFFLSTIKRNYIERERERPLIDRTALHAFSLSLMHPSTGKKINIEAPVPKDINAVLKVLRKYQGVKKDRSPDSVNGDAE